jgi:SagB-type dehydrogenase family enzyme
MRHTDLLSPKPRKRELPFKEFQYKFGRRLYLPVPESSIDRNFLDVLAARETRRTFGQLGTEALSQLLWYSSKTRATRRSGNGDAWQHRPCPSAGGRHPIDIMVWNHHGDPETVYRYDPIAHCLSEICEVDKASLAKLMRAINEVVPVGPAIILWFVAQFDRTLAKYLRGESLVWRDSGALLATVYLVAEALDLNCCGIGITGEPWISAALKGKKRLCGVGGCFVGERAAKP